jgi:hypothetical protein
VNVFPNVDGDETIFATGHGDRRSGVVRRECESVPWRLLDLQGQIHTLHELNS